MKIALYGATGSIGQRILAEALRRGHSVTALVRDPARLTVGNDQVKVIAGDATDAVGVAEAVRGHDVVIGSISGRRDGDAGKIAEAARSLIQGVEIAGGDIGLLWVGGAGSLEVSPGIRLMDTPGFPEAYRSEANAGAEALAAFRGSPASLDWTYISPAAIIAPGQRTGNYHVGTENLVVDEKGDSKISIEDYAVALIDEVENPKYQRRRFTVAY